MKHHCFGPLFTTNFFGVFNDNFLKTLAMFLLSSWIPDEKTKSLCLGIAAGALVLPYILLSPFANRLMQWYSKKNIFLTAKWAELPIMAIAITGIHFHSIPVMIFSVMLMGAQSSLYSPVKYSLVRDIGGADRVSVGMGGLDGLSFLATLIGTVTASFFIDCAPLYVSYLTLILAALFGALSCYTIRAEEERETTEYPINPFIFLKQIHRQIGKYPGLNGTILLLGVFWWTVAMMQMGLLLYGTDGLKLTAFQTGLILALAAVGIALGNIVAGIVNRKTLLLKQVPAFGIIGAVLLLLLAVLPLSPVLFSILLGIFAFETGFFKVPLDTVIQQTVKGPMLNTVLSYVNQVEFLFILGASACYALATMLFGVRAFLVLGGIVLAISSLLYQKKRQ